MNTPFDEARLLRAKVGITLDHPFFASILLRRPFIEDSSIKTACTNGEYIKYNPEFFASLSAAELKGVIVHELYHITNLHHTRREGRDIKIWNKACDFAVNPLLIDGGFKLPKGALIDPNFTGKSAEEIYRILSRNEQESQKNQQQGDQTGGGGGRPDQQSQPGDNPQPGQDPGQQPQQPDNDPGECGGVEDAPADTQAEMDAKESQTKMEIQQARMIAKQMGSLPWDVDRLIERVLEPRINWQEVLARFLYERVRNDYSFSRPNTRYAGSGFILPSLYNLDAGEIVLIADTSLSMDRQKLEKTVAEMQDICSSFHTPFTILYVDTKVQHHQVIEPDDTYELKPKGGGGTDFRPGFKWLEDHGRVPKCVVYFTDMECTRIPPEPEYDVLWVNYGNRDKKAPFGELINID